MNFYGIIKFGEAEHIKELYENGTIFMQRAENYAKIEHDEIGDKHENLSHLYQPEYLTSVKINGEEIKSKIT